MPYEETDAVSENRTQRPILDERIGRFPERLEKCIGARSVRSIARTCGLSETVIRKYLKAESLPTIDRALAIADAVGVRPEWLATGDGPMRNGEETTENNHIGCDTESLVLAIETVEEGLAVTGRVMRPARKAELVMAVYELFTESAGKVDRGIVLRLVKSAS